MPEPEPAPSAPRSGLATRLLGASRTLAEQVGKLRFAEPVAHVYNPLVYARAPHEAYLRRFARFRPEALLLGMNPGPFGMAQTGVPFGEVSLVRDWLGIQGEVARPPGTHPRRPVQGFACPRSEVSGKRLWGWARERFRTPERFFLRFFVWNYCPLLFLEASGRNLTPDRLGARDRGPLLEVCDEALRAVVAALSPERVIGVGGFAAKRARQALGAAPPAFVLPHPSPASPQANRGWAALAERALGDAGITLDVGP